MIGELMLGLGRHLLGDQASARRHTEHMLVNFVRSEQRSHEAIHFEIDQASRRASTSRILLFQGFPTEAMRTTKGEVDEAGEINHAVSLCHALTLAACPIILWVGDLAAAERYIAILLDHSARLGLTSWKAWGRCLREVLAVGHGDLGPVPA